MGGEALLEVVAPGFEVVDPGLDGEDPGAGAVDDEAGRPHIVDQGGHGGKPPFALALGFVKEAGGDVVVAIGEDGGGDIDPVTQDAACGIASAIDLGLDGFDYGSFTAFCGFHWIGVTGMRGIDQVVAQTRVRWFGRWGNLTEELPVLNIG